MNILELIKPYLTGRDEVHFNTPELLREKYEEALNNKIDFTDNKYSIDSYTYRKIKSDELVQQMLKSYEIQKPDVCNIVDVDGISTVVKVKYHRFAPFKNDIFPYQDNKIVSLYDLLRNNVNHHIVDLLRKRCPLDLMEYAYYEIESSNKKSRMNNYYENIYNHMKELLED